MSRSRKVLWSTGIKRILSLERRIIVGCLRFCDKIMKQLCVSMIISGLPRIKITKGILTNISLLLSNFILYKRAYKSRENMK